MFYTNVSAIGNYVYSRGYDDKGKAFDTREEFSPTFYLRSNTETGIRNIANEYVRPVKHDTIRAARDWLKRYEGNDEVKVYGTTNYVSQYITEKFGFDISIQRPLIDVCYLDIEVQSDSGFPTPSEAAYPVLTITIKKSKENKFIVWGLVDYNPNSTELKELEGRIVYHKCSSEYELLRSFINYWCRNHPDVITGWYTKMFDIPYLVNRIGRILGADTKLKLSPWKQIREQPIQIAGRTHQTYNIEGIQSLDYIELFQKFGYVYGTQESYKLDHIANVVLGQKKLDYDEYGNLHTLYKENPQKYVDYNIRDVDLVERIDNKLDYISLVTSIAGRAGVNYRDALGTVVVWDNILYRELIRENVVINPKVVLEREEYSGGFVKDPHVGRHEWVCSFDLNSLYPSLIVQYNMSPETITGFVDSEVTIERILEGFKPKHNGNAVTANGVHFSKSKLGIIPRIVKQLYEERVVVKKQMLEAKQTLEEIDSILRDAK